MRCVRSPPRLRRRAAPAPDRTVNRLFEGGRMTARQFHERVSELDITGRSFLTIHDFSPAEVVALLDLATELKAAQKRREPHAVLAGRAVAMIFRKTSTRTRVSFEIGIEQLGAQPMFLGANDIHLRVGETIKDTANVMSPVSYTHL